MHQPQSNNQALTDGSDIAIARLSRFSGNTEGSIRQSFLLIDGLFHGMRFESGVFEARWLFAEGCIEFKRGDQLIERLPLTISDQQQIPTRRAA